MCGAGTVVSVNDATERFPTGAASFNTPANVGALHPGSVVGGYELVRRLGEGGMGVVWSARDGGGQRVAIKILHPHIAAEPTSRQRLQREAQVLGRIKDDRVARVLDMEISDTDACFVVTELVNGPTLQAAVEQEGPYDLETERENYQELAHALVGALQSVHKCGVLHRDLKPANVMLGDSGPVLIDFGIAQVSDDSRLTKTGQVTGTPGFISPEMLDGAAPDQEADYFACAGVLLFALTGQAPFGEGPWQNVFQRVYNGKPFLGELTDTHPELAQAFTLALSPTRDQRLKIEDLLRVIDGEQLPAPQVPAAQTEVLSNTAALPLVSPTMQMPTQTAVMPAVSEAQPSVQHPPQVVPAAEPQVTSVPQAANWQQAVMPVQTIPEWAREPMRRPALVFAWALLLTALASVWPGWDLVGFLAVLVLLGTIGRAGAARRRVRVSRGTAEAGDTWRMWLGSPWYLLRSLLGSALAAGLAAIFGVGLVYLGQWAQETGRLAEINAQYPQLTLDVLGRSIYAVAMLVFLLLAWFGPGAGPARRGAATVFSVIVPTAGMRWLHFMAVIACALVLVFLVLQGSMPGVVLSPFEL